jgi:broad specificity phosphatase PhoE
VGDSSVRLYGRTDIALSDLGREQMRRAGAALRRVAFQTAIVSPLQRSRESADILLDGRGPALRVTPEFREIDFGAWEGWTFAEVAERDPENHASWKTMGVDFAFPGAETKKSFFERIAAAAVRIFPEAQSPALAVLHKGVIKGILAGLLGRPVAALADHPIELGGIHLLRRDAGGWTLVQSNEIAHLGDCRLPDSK